MFFSNTKADEPSNVKPTSGPRVANAFSVNLAQPETEAAVVPNTSQSAHHMPEIATPGKTEITLTPQVAPNLYKVAENVAPDKKPSVATTSVSVTRRPKSDHNKETRIIKRLSSSGEETDCTQSRSFRALEKLLFDDENL